MKSYCEIVVICFLEVPLMIYKMARFLSVVGFDFCYISLSRYFLRQLFVALWKENVKWFYHRRYKERDSWHLDRVLFQHFNFSISLPSSDSVFVVILLWMNKWMNEGMTHWLTDWLNECMNEWKNELKNKLIKEIM